MSLRPAVHCVDISKTHKMNQKSAKTDQKQPNGGQTMHSEFQVCNVQFVTAIFMTVTGTHDRYGTLLPSYVGLLFTNLRILFTELQSDTPVQLYEAYKT